MHVGGGRDTLEISALGKVKVHMSSAKQPPLNPSWLRRHLRETYGRRTMVLVKQYFRCMSDLAMYTNNAALLLRCRAMRIVPPEYRVRSRDTTCTRQVARILDECSYRLMLADLDYNLVRKLQVYAFLEPLLNKLEEIMYPEDLSHMVVLAEAMYGDVFGD
ncbi:uncharacterized protein LOC144160742 [Haemaphysalis longicornis]